MSLTLSANSKELRRQFYSLRTREDVANLLEIEEERLIYHLYIVPESERYKHFVITKKSGEIRHIMAPATALKIIQRKLNQVLQAVYQPKAPVHGFVVGRNLVTNAKVHAKRKYVLNIDLKDFFPSINFGRVRGMFMATPYNLNPEVATILAQICCFENQLPQGAPTSPIVSNMICAKMDSHLRRLAQKYKCMYTRYADDITFSTSLSAFPPELATHSSVDGQVEIGAELNEIIRENGFSINHLKVRMYKFDRRQEVTGLTVNRFANVDRRDVKRVRAMLHAWRKYGEEAAEKEYFAKYNSKIKNPNKKPSQFRYIVRGRIEFIGMVRGKHDRVYLNLCEQLAKLAPELAPGFLNTRNSDSNSCKVEIFTEGMTDWKHIKAAYIHLSEMGKISGLDLEFFEYNEDVKMGGDNLREMLENYSLTFHEQLQIFIFDNDEDKIIKKMKSPGKRYKNWGNNVFSLVIPTPPHRPPESKVSIELYYKDDDIKLCDQNGRRLYLNTEFNPRSGWHLKEDLICDDRNKRKITDRTVIIDNSVYNRNHENVTLPKSDFAQYILNREGKFADVDFSAFMVIFEEIMKILDEYKQDMDAPDTR